MSDQNSPPSDPQSSGNPTGNNPPPRPLVPTPSNPTPPPPASPSAPTQTPNAFKPVAPTPPPVSKPINQSTSQPNTPPPAQQSQPASQPTSKPAQPPAQPTKPVLQREPAPTQPTTPSPSVPKPATSEVIQGAPTKPGDKPEPAASTDQPTSRPDQPPVATTPTPPAKKSSSPLAPTGKKLDGTPLDGEEKIFAALGYIGILALLPLLARRDSEFAQHHGRQGLVVAVIFIFLWIFAKLAGNLALLVFILQIVAIIGGFLLAFKGDWFRIPGIYEISLKLKFAPKKPPATPNNEPPPSA